MLTYGDYVSKILELAKFLVVDERIQNKISVVLSFSQSGMAPVAFIRLKRMYVENSIESEIEFWQHPHEDDIMYIFASAGFIEPTGTPIFLIDSEWFKCVDVDDAKVVIEKIIELYE